MTSRRTSEASRVVEKLTLEKALLVQAAVAQALPTTGKQIDRYRYERLLPPAGLGGRGRGAGVARPAPAGSVQQLIALRRALEESRSLDRAAVRLWLDGYNVPLDRIRQALRETVAAPMRAMMKLGASEFESRAFRSEGAVLERRTTPKRARKLARQNELVFMLKSIFQAISGSELDEENFKRLARGFEQSLPLDEARSGMMGSVHVGPLFTGDANEPLQMALAAFSSMAQIDEISDLEFLQARTDYKAFEPVLEFAQIIQQHFGRDTLGLSALTHDVLGADQRYNEPLRFAGIFALFKIRPDLRINLEIICEAAQGSLEKIKSEIAKMFLQ